MDPVLGIDHGDARIGVAVSDALRLLAHPVATVAARPAEAAMAEIAAILRTRRATEIVIGLPIRQDGSEGPSAEKVRAFAAALAAHLPPGTPIHFQDEYGTTMDAAAALRAAGRRPKHHRPVIDQAAAAVILQGWLDRTAPAELPPPDTEE
jgi:putative holliday junction resolvase